jgi:hypothetical protein
MRAPITFHVVDGGDHSFAVSRTPREQVLDRVLDAVAAWTRAADHGAR